MPLTRNDIREAVFRAIRQIMETEVELNEATKPIDDLDLDSEDGLDFADILSDLLQITIPANVNPFKNDAAQKARTIGEIIDLVLNLSPQGRANE